MNEDRVSNITPSEEDPVVDRWLNSLPELVPSPGFEDAVMARVWRPAPSWLQSMQSATRALFSGKRVWMWAGGLAASSAVSMVILVGLAVSNWVQVETAWSVFFATSSFAISLLTVRRLLRVIRVPTAWLVVPASRKSFL